MLLLFYGHCLNLSVFLRRDFQTLPLASSSHSYERKSSHLCFSPIRAVTHARAQCLGVWVSVGGGCLGISGGGAMGSSESSRGSDILANLVGKDGPFPNGQKGNELV